MSYSEALQIPVALLWHEYVLELRQSLNRAEHVVKSYYRFSMRKQVSDVGYNRWASGVLTRHNLVGKYT